MIKIAEHPRWTTANAGLRGKPNKRTRNTRSEQSNRPLWLSGDIADNAGLIETALREGRQITLARFKGGPIRISVTPPCKYFAEDKPQ